MQELENLEDQQILNLEEDNIHTNPLEWNPKRILNYRTYQRKLEPILCGCEVDKQTLAFGTGNPGNKILIYDRV